MDIEDIVGPHSPVDIHIPNAVRLSAMYSKNSLSHSLKSYHQAELPPFSSQPRLLPNSDNSDTDSDDEIDDDESCDSSDVDSDMEIDYGYTSFSRPPSRMGHHPSSTKSSKRNSRRKSSTTSITRLKVDNSFLKSQNVKLLLELEHSRLTIQALKNIVNQKEATLQSVCGENQKAILKIRVLEALILSKHAKDGSVIVRSGGGGGGECGVLMTSANNDDNSGQFTPYKKTDVKVINKVSPSIQPPQSLSPSQTISQTQPISSQKPPLPPPKRSNGHYRRWSMDFGPRNNTNNKENGSIGSDEMDITQSSPSRRHSVSPTSSSTAYTSTTANESRSSSRSMPRLIKRKTGSIIQSIASCRPTSTKNGYDFSPPDTPTPSDRSEFGSEDAEQDNVEEICESVDENVIHEKLQKQRKQSLLSRIFSSSTSTSKITAAARGSLSR